MSVMIFDTEQFAQLVAEGIQNYKFGYFETLRDAEEYLAKQVGCSVRSIRNWKRKKELDSEFSLIQDLDAFLSFLVAILSKGKGWDIYEPGRKAWLRNILNCTSEGIGEELTQGLFENLLSHVTLEAKPLNSTEVHRITQLVFQPTRTLFPNEIDERVNQLKDISSDLFLRGDYANALEYLDRAIADAKENNHLALEANCLAFRGLVLTFQGRYIEAYSNIQNGLDISKRISDRLVEGYALRNLGVLAEKQDDHDRAIDYYAKACKIALETGNVYLQCLTAGDLGNEDDFRGNYRRARIRYRFALRAARKLQDRYLETVQLGNMANISDKLNRYDEALVLYGQALAIADVANDLYNVAVHHHNMGEIYRKRKTDSKKARQHFFQAYTITRNIGDSEGQWEAIREIAKTFEQEGAIEEARQQYIKAQEVARKANNQQWYETVENELQELNAKP